MTANTTFVKCKNGVAVIVHCSNGHYDADKQFANGCESTTAPKKGKHLRN